MNKKTMERIVWWIPIKKIRDIFRNFLNKPTQNNSSYNYAFNHDIDNILLKLGKIARKKIENTSQEKRKKILYFLGYHHSKFAAIIDVVNILALQIRCVEVYTVRSSFFYKNQDVIFGGLYNENRFENSYQLSFDKGLLFSCLIQTKSVHLSAFISREDVIFANSFTDSIDISDWRTIKYNDMQIGEMAYYVTVNLRNQAMLYNSKEEIYEFKEHIKNCILLDRASYRLISTISPDTIVSNFPFYYQWKIPYINSMKLNIPYYSFMISERKNSIFWSCNSNFIYDSRNCWNSFIKSDIAIRYKVLVEKAIKDRFNGNISNHKVIPNANIKNKRLINIINSIKYKPTVLFACNILCDASVLMSTESFSGLPEMIIETIKWFNEHQEYNCILKAHPAEKLLIESGSDMSNGHLKYFLEHNNVKITDNIKFIDYDEEISVYSLFDHISAVVAYTSSVCLDAGLYGKQSISIDSCHYTMAGFCQVPNSKKDFFIKIDNILNNRNIMTKDNIVNLAKNYYLLYYYIGQVNFNLYRGNDTGTIPLEIFFDSEEDILNEKNKPLNYIMDCILNNQPIFGNNKWPPVSL